MLSDQATYIVILSANIFGKVRTERRRRVKRGMNEKMEGIEKRINEKKNNFRKMKRNPDEKKIWSSLD